MLYQSECTVMTIKRDRAWSERLTLNWLYNVTWQLLWWILDIKLNFEWVTVCGKTNKVKAENYLKVRNIVLIFLYRFVSQKYDQWFGSSCVNVCLRFWTYVKVCSNWMFGDVKVFLCHCMNILHFWLLKQSSLCTTDKWQYLHQN